MDGFEILRRGDSNVDCRLVLHISHYPERFRVLEPLAGLVGMKEGTRSEVMAAVWKLVKFSGAQDKEDGTIIRPSGGLEKVSTISYDIFCLRLLCNTSSLCRVDHTTWSRLDPIPPIT